MTAEGCDFEEDFGDYQPAPWELCATRFFATGQAMLAEGFTVGDVLKGLSFATADIVQDIEPDRNSFDA